MRETYIFVHLLVKPQMKKSEQYQKAINASVSSVFAVFLWSTPIKPIRENRRRGTHSEDLSGDVSDPVFLQLVSLRVLHQICDRTGTTELHYQLPNRQKQSLSYLTKTINQNKIKIHLKAHSLKKKKKFLFACP